MPAIHISDLADAGPYDLKDKLQFQRNVLGTWQDFHTDIETYFGPILTATFEWDGSIGFSETLDETGFIIVPIEVYALFTPGVAPTSQSAQIGIQDVGPGAVGSMLSEFVDTNQAQAITFGYVNPNMTTREGLQISASILGIDPFSGTTTITIRYVKAIPI